MAQSPLRFGIIGLGKIGRIHLRHLESLPGGRVTALAENSPAADLPVGVVRDWREVATHPEVDAVIIALPHSLHAPVAAEALAAGKHLFLEKPLATSYRDAAALVEQAEQVGATLMVNMTHRFYPPLRKARELLRSGVLGNVISVRDYYMEILDRSDFPKWFFDPVMAGGGVAMTDSIHLIDRVEWLLGEPLDFVGGAARQLMPESSVEDCAEILCTSRSGVPVTIGSFFYSGPKMWEDGLTLFGTLGWMKIRAWSHVEWQLYGGEVQRWEGYAPESHAAFRSQIGHRAALLEFIEALREGRPPEGDGVSTLNPQKVVHDFYASVQRNNFREFPHVR